jgi:hypothetical protein
MTGKRNDLDLLRGMIFPKESLVPVIKTDNPVPIELIKRGIRRGSIIMDDIYGHRFSSDVKEDLCQLIHREHPKILDDKDLKILRKKGPRIKIGLATMGGGKTTKDIGLILPDNGRPMKIGRKKGKHL